MKLYLLPLLVLLSSCTFFKKHETHQEKVYPLLTSDNLKQAGFPAYDTKKIKMVLKREGTLGGGTYEINAFPITKTYLQALTNELSNERGLNKRQSLKIKKEYYNKYVKNKICFSFTYAATRFEKVKYLKAWDLELDYDKVNKKLKFTKADLRKEPVQSQRRIGNDVLEQWNNTAIACTKSYISLNKEFHLKVTPSFVQFPFDSDVVLKWEFDHFVVNEKGEQVKVESSNSSYQPYRGW